METLEEKNYELLLAEEWWSSLPISDRKDILKKCNTEYLSDGFLILVWMVTLWLTKSDVEKKIQEYKITHRYLTALKLK